MKTLALLALVLPSLAFAAADPAKLRDAALNDTLAYEIVEGLTTEVGARMTDGSAAQAAIASNQVAVKANELALEGARVVVIVGFERVAFRGDEAVAAFGQSAGGTCTG